MSKQNQSNIPTLFFDGGSRGNPGPAAGAGVIIMPDGQRHTVTQFLDNTTNNVAEYTGLIVGLAKAGELGIEELVVCGDSNLVVNQVKGKWKINQPHLRELAGQATSLIGQFRQVKLFWVPREENRLADEAVNQCLDFAQRPSPLPPFERGGERGGEQKQPPQMVEGVAPAVAKLIRLGSKASFQDYQRLKSGRDQFSAKGLSALQKLIPDETKQAIAAEWDGNESYLAKVYRWYLRGLPPDMALHKVRVDAEIEANARGRHPWLEDFFKNKG